MQYIVQSMVSIDVEIARLIFCVLILNLLEAIYLRVRKVEARVVLFASSSFRFAFRQL